MVMNNKHWLLHLGYYSMNIDRDSHPIILPCYYTQRNIVLPSKQVKNLHIVGLLVARLFFFLDDALLTQNLECSYKTVARYSPQFLPGLPIWKVINGLHQVFAVAHRNWVERHTHTKIQSWIVLGWGKLQDWITIDMFKLDKQRLGTSTRTSHQPLTGARAPVKPLIISTKLSIDFKQIRQDMWVEMIQKYGWKRIIWSCFMKWKQSQLSSVQNLALSLENDRLRTEIKFLVHRLLSNPQWLLD